MPVSSERSCGRAQPRMVPTLVDLVVVDAHRIRALPAPRESEQGESLDLLRDTLAHTIRENPDISMEGLPRKSSAPPITLGPAIVHRELDRSALRGATSAPTQRLFRVVCHGVPAAPNCTNDEGGPFGVGDHELISSRRKLLWPNTTVVSVTETSGQDPDRHGCERRAQANRQPPARSRSRDTRGKPTPSSLEEGR